MVGPDDPTILTRPLADLGDPDARADDPTLADITRASLPVARPSRPLIPATPSAPRDRVEQGVPWRRRLQPQEIMMLVSGVVFILALVLIVTALALRPILSLFPGSPAAQQIAARSATATPLPTITPTPSPAAPATTVTFAALDTNTQGNWQGTYGSAGYVLAGDDTQQLPSSIQVTPSGAAPYTWAASTDDDRALVKPENTDDRIAACWYAPTSFTIDVNITDGQTYQLALYALDWDQQNRVETISIVDPSTGAALDTRPVSDFGNGEYLVWQVRGHVTIQVINAADSLNAVVSGLFFAPVASS